MGRDGGAPSPSTSSRSLSGASGLAIGHHPACGSANLLCAISVTASLLAYNGVFGRKSSKIESLQDTVSPELHESLARLDRLAIERPELLELVPFYRELLALLFGRARPVRPLVVSSDEIAKKLADGVPILRGVSLELDDPSPSESWRNLCLLVSRFRADTSPAEVASIAALQQVTPTHTLKKVLSADPNEFCETLGQSRSESGQLLSSLRLWALPRLAPVVQVLERHWLGPGWPRGYCPACGSWPLLAESRGLEQFRWLRCGLCGAGWQVDRIFCPFCETRDHRQLQDLFVAGEESRRRVSVCDACRGFVRGVSTLVALTAPGLLVAELETLHLELIARERGYSAAPQSADDQAVDRSV